MNNTKFFLHIDPSQTGSLLLAHMETLSQGSDPLANAILDAGELAFAAELTGVSGFSGTSG
jgi:hypothetical protein